MKKTQLICLFRIITHYWGIALFSVMWIKISDHKHYNIFRLFNCKNEL